MDMQNITDLHIPEGNVRTIRDKNNRLLWGRVSYSIKYSGDVAQNGTPTPDNPVPIQTVTGEQTVTISNGVDSEDFTISLGSTELCKIGDYQDYIYKSGDDWYIHKEIGKYTFNGTENWNSGPYGVNSWILNNIITTAYVETNLQAISSKFLGIPASERNRAGSNVCYMATNTQFWLRNTSLTSLNDVHAVTTGMDVYYALSTPTETQITDSSLINQLEDVNEWLTRYGYTYNVSGNVPININRAIL